MKRVACQQVFCHQRPHWVKRRLKPLRSISLTGQVLHHVWCTLSQVPSILPTSDLNQSVLITSIFSSRTPPPPPSSASFSLGNPTYCHVLSAFHSPYTYSWCDLFVLTSAGAQAGLGHNSIMQTPPETCCFQVHILNVTLTVHTWNIRKETYPAKTPC